MLECSAFLHDWQHNPAKALSRQHEPPVKPLALVVQQVLLVQGVLLVQQCLQVLHLVLQVLQLPWLELP